MPARVTRTKNFQWYYFSDFKSEDLEFLKSNFKFHPLDLKDCLGEIQRTKIDLYKNYLFLVFQLPFLDLNENKILINQVYFFVGKDYLVTITREKIKPLNGLFYKIVNNQKLKEELLAAGSGYLLYKILDLLLRNSWLTHANLDLKIKEVEAEIDEGRGKKVVLSIANLRRLILQLKGVIDPQKVVTNTLSKLKLSFLSKGITVYFDDLDDFVEKNWFIIESYKDRILTLQEINESLISYRTNQVMRILTVFSVALMPLTLLSGIYGMNINLPFSERPTVIWELFGGLAVIIIGIFIFLKRKDLI